MIKALTVIAAIILSGYATTGTSARLWPAPNAGDVWSYITEDSRYTDWDLWPEKTLNDDGTPPHGRFLKTYVNMPALRSIVDRAGMSHESVIVQENYGSDNRLSFLMVMYKVPGYNPDAGNWFWARYLPDGKAEESGKIGTCIECHGRRKENDYIMAMPVKYHD